MQKILIKIWLIIFLFTLIPWSEYRALVSSVPTTQAEHIVADGEQLSFINQPDGTHEYISPVTTAVFSFDTVTGVWQVAEHTSASESFQLLLRVQTPRGWSGWREVEENFDLSDTGPVHMGEMLYVNHADALQYKIVLHGKAGVYPQVEHIAISYLHSDSQPNFAVASAQSGLNIIPRSGWGADENLRFTDAWGMARAEYCKKAPWACLPLSDKTRQELQQKKDQLIQDFPEEMQIVQTIASEEGKELVWSKEYTAKVRKLVVHHTADDLSANDNTNSTSANNNGNVNGNGLTAADYQARIRSTYYYHTVVRGWGDIGYNYIVDPLGNIYEGRSGGDRVVGAHVAWYNEGSVGISLMGNYETNDISLSAMNGVVDALVYLTRKYGLDPTATSSFRGKILPNIIGHRDLAPTACPGGHFYEKIPQIRALVAGRINSPDAIKIPIVGSINQANDKYSTQYVGTELQDVVLPPTSEQAVRFRFKNTGTATWDANTYLEGCCSFDPTLDVAGRQLTDTTFHVKLQTAPVPPGGMGEFVIPFLSGYIERVNIIEMAPVVNGLYKVQSILVPVAVNTPNYGYEYISSVYPKVNLFFGEKTTASVVLKNTGNITWVNSGENAIVLKPDRARWRTTDFHPEDKTILATLQEDKVLPGQIGHFNFNLTAPTQVRLYEEYFTPYIKQVGYFKDVGMYFRFLVSDSAGRMQYDFAEQNLESLFLLPGEERTIPVLLKNTDSRTWDNIQQKNLELFAYGLEGGTVGTVTVFDKNTVAPGETATLSLQVRMPTKPGRYVVNVLPRIGTNNLLNRRLEVTLYVTPATPRAKLKSVLFTPDKPVLRQPTQVTVTVENTGNLPWYKGKTNLGKFSDRDKASNFYDSSWLTPLRPATLMEEVVRPGETGTFTFTVTPQKTGLIEEFFKLGVQDIGWVIMDTIPLRLSVSSNGTLLNANTNSITSLAGLSTLYHKNIRVRLGFTPSNNQFVVSTNTASSVTNGTTSQPLSVDQAVTLTYENNQITARWNDKVMTGSSLALGTPASGIVTVQNWERYQAWDTNKQYNDNRFRGKMNIMADNGKLVLVNELPLEDYLHGVAEVPENNHVEKKKTMSILARTYALFYLDPNNRKFPGKSYDASDDPNVFQKYLGYGFEQRSPLWNQAVTDTRGQVVMYQGKLIKTPYFSQSDGRTRSAQEVWGWTDTPYLVSVSDPLCPDKTLLGHGVGLSGCGAEAAAESGKTYDAIIKYYYQGVEIGKVE